MTDSLTTYDELNEDIQFTEEETRALLKLSDLHIILDASANDDGLTINGHAAALALADWMQPLPRPAKP